MILPACPFPPLSWYKLAYSEGAASVIDIHENYIKQSLRNRMLLANSQGVWDLTLPVHRRNMESRAMKDVLFTDQMDPGLLLKNIKTAYSSAPYYEHFEESLMELFGEFGNPGQSLLEFNLATLDWVVEELGISSIEVSKEYIKVAESDFRKKGVLNSEKWIYTEYPQVFEDRNGFLKGRSILDAIFHGGPEVKRWWGSVSLPV